MRRTFQQAAAGRTTGAAGAFRPAVLLALGLALSGCLKAGPEVSMNSPSRPATLAGSPGELALAADDTTTRGEAQSALIAELRARPSVLPAGSPYATVAEAVLDANKGTAAAELRVARLRAEAKSKNWLPSLGPSVDLTSLGAAAASMLVDQVLFDNGRRKAEREFSAADVEVAAVSLATELNTRVYEGLANYIAAERARDQVALAESALVRMNDFGRIMRLRVEGGLSDRSEERVVLAKIAETEATLATERDAGLTAQAELAAMASRDLSGVRGLSALPDAPGTKPMAVLQAMGEGRRMIAEAKIGRAGLLPGLKASATAGGSGLTGGLRAASETPFGFGTRANLAALEATKEVALQRRDSAEDDAKRRIVALERQIATLAAEQSKGASVLQGTEATLETFTEQYKVGRRPLMELVGMFETWSQMQREHAALTHEMALLRLKIARERGVLVDGARM